MRADVCRALIGLWLIAAATGGFTTAVAQPLPPAVAIQRAVADLESRGYVASFRREGGDAVRGVVAFGSPVAYRLRIEPEEEPGFEYLVLDFALFTRVLPPNADPGGWERRQWHPDVPIDPGSGYHPRMPLELARLLSDPRDAGRVTESGQTLRLIEGNSSFAAALLASHEDGPARGAAVQAITRNTWPVRLWLDDTTGALVRLELTIPPGNVIEAPPGSITYDFAASDTPKQLEPPSDAIDVPSRLALRDTPPGPPMPLPLAMEGRGTVLETPLFRLDQGTLLMALSQVSSGTTYRLWRSKRGALLVSAIGTVTGAGGATTLPLELPPGDYVLEITFPTELETRLTLSQADAPP